MKKNELLRKPELNLSLDEKEVEKLEMTKVLEWLMPWREKTLGEQTFGDWQDTMALTMMVKLLELWVTEPTRKRIEGVLRFYHPVDRAAMAYALVVFVMTGHRMKFKSVVANWHYKLMREYIISDMPYLTFAGHVKYMMRKYGKKMKN